LGRYHAYDFCFSQVQIVFPKPSSRKTRTLVRTTTVVAGLSIALMIMTVMMAALGDLRDDFHRKMTQRGAARKFALLMHQPDEVLLWPLHRHCRQHSFGWGRRLSGLNFLGL